MDQTRPKDEVAGAFYAVQILADLDTAPAHAAEIAQAIRKLEQPQGGFISHPDARSSAAPRFGADLLATYQALQTLHRLGQSPDSFAATRNWLLSVWQNDALFPAEPDGYEHALAPTEAELVIRSLGLLGVDIRQSPIIQQRRAWLEQFAAKWQAQLPQLPHGAGLFDIVALIEMGAAFGQPVAIAPATIETLKAYQTRSGGWSTFLNSMPDDAGTYLAVRILTYAQRAVPRSRELILSIQLRAEQAGGYLPVVTSQSSAHLTYAALFSLATFDQQPLHDSAVRQFVTSTLTSGLDQPDPAAESVRLVYYSLAASQLMKIPVPDEAAQSWCDQLSVALQNHIEPQIESLAYFLKSARLAQCRITPSFKSQVVPAVQALQQSDGSFGLQTVQPLERAALAVSILHALGEQPRDPQALTAWLERYRKPAGGYGITQAGDLLSTYHVVEAYVLLNKSIPEASEIAIWIDRQCKDTDGGYIMECQPEKQAELLPTWWSLQIHQRLDRLDDGE